MLGQIRRRELGRRGAEDQSNAAVLDPSLLWIYPCHLLLIVDSILGAMATRNLPNYLEENASKRPRLDDGKGIQSIATLDVLPPDCKVNICAFLNSRQLANIACCGREWNQARNNESLDQERFATIVFTAKSTASSTQRLMRRIGDENVFSGNCSSLVVEGIENIPEDATFRIGTHRLEGVTKLQILAPRGNDESNPFVRANTDVLMNLVESCPNVTDVELDGIQVKPLNFDLSRPWRSNIKQLTWNGCNDGIFVNGTEMPFCRPTSSKLKSLYLDGAVFCTTYSPTECMDSYGSMWEPHGRRSVFLSDCINLERLSIKGAKLSCCFDRLRQRPLPQEVIIKFVRLHPNLCWLRSDLTDENVVMLMSERSDVTFVS